MVARLFIILLVCLSAVSTAAAQTQRTVVADSVTRHPLPSAAVFDRDGNVLGMTDNRGRLPYISADDFPVTLRYLGFHERTVGALTADTIFMTESTTELPEFQVETRQHKVLHVLAYVREYSTLSSYTDTVFMFREKMVDFMLTPDPKVRFQGWRLPRVIKSDSYYRFTNAQGLDSVSSRCNNHFSWSDWIGLVPSPAMPGPVRRAEFAADTVFGKYSPTEIWTRRNDRVTVDVNVLADTTSRKWVPNLSAFFKKHLDFENFRVRYNYDGVADDSIAMTDLSAYSFSIESDGRGREMFKFNRQDEPVYVSTFGEVYILDKEYITVKEAKKWKNRKFETENLEIIVPAEAPELTPSVRELAARVNAINHIDVRTDLAPDRRLIGRRVKVQNIGERAFSLLKQLTGITAIRARRSWNKSWKTFRDDRKSRNRE